MFARTHSVGVMTGLLRTGVWRQSRKPTDSADPLSSAHGDDAKSGDDDGGAAGRGQPSLTRPGVRLRPAVRRIPTVVPAESEGLPRRTSSSHQGRLPRGRRGRSPDPRQANHGSSRHIRPLVRRRTRSCSKREGRLCLALRSWVCPTTPYAFRCLEHRFGWTG